MFLIVFRAIMISSSGTVQKGVIRDQRKEKYRKTKVTTTLLPSECVIAFVLRRPHFECQFSSVNSSPLKGNSTGEATESCP